MNTPPFTLRLHTPERAAMALLVAAGKAGGRASYVPSDAIRAALRFAARDPEGAAGLAPITKAGPRAALRLPPA